MTAWLRTVTALAEEFGGKVAHTSGSHLAINLPNGGRVTVSMTASDHRALKNVRGDLRRESRRVLDTRARQR